MAIDATTLGFWSALSRVHEACAAARVAPPPGAASLQPLSRPHSRPYLAFERLQPSPRPSGLCGASRSTRSLRRHRPSTPRSPCSRSHFYLIELLATRASSATMTASLRELPEGCPAARLHSAVERRLEACSRLGRYTLAEVAQHNQPEDAWIACFDKASSGLVAGGAGRRRARGHAGG